MIRKPRILVADDEEFNLDNISFCLTEAGFDWRHYLDFAAERMTDLHGRGIASSRLMSFDKLEYLGAGIEVRRTVSLARNARPSC